MTLLPPRADFNEEQLEWVRWVEKNIGATGRTVRRVARNTLATNKAITAVDSGLGTTVLQTASYREMVADQARKPAKVTGVAASSTGVYDLLGRPSSRLSVLWTPVGLDTAGENIIVAQYEVWGKRQEEPDTAYALIGTSDSTPFVGTYLPGTAVTVKVRAHTIYNIYGEFSDPVNHTTATPTITPPTPSAPTLTSEMGVVIVAWNGLDNAGNAVPMWVDGVQPRVMWSGQPWKDMGQVIGGGATSILAGIPVGTSVTVGLRAKTSTGQLGPMSATATIVVASVTSSEIDEAITDAIEEAMQKAEGAQASADGKTMIYYSATAPTVAPGDPPFIVGSTWFDTSNGNRQARWSGSAWVVTLMGADALAAAVNNAISSAQTDATTALQTANGKNTVTFATTDPVDYPNMRAGDVWYRRTSGVANLVGMWQRTASSWDSRLLDGTVLTDVIANTITSGFLNSDRIQARSLFANKIVLGNYANLVDDADFALALGSTDSPWEMGGSSSIGWSTPTSTSSKINKYLQRVGTAATGPSNFVNSYRVPVYEGEQYVLSFDSYNLADPTASVGVQFYNSAGAPLSTSAVSAVTSTGWTDRTHRFTVPALAYWMSLRIADNGVTGTTFRVANIMLRRMADASLIVDGLIQAGSAIIAEAAIGHAQMSSVDAGKITVGELDGKIIRANSASFSALLVSNLNNMLQDPGFEYNSPLAWQVVNANAENVAALPRSGSRSLRLNTQASAYVGFRSVAAWSVEPNEEYRISGWVRLASGTSAAAGVALRVASGPTETSTGTTSPDSATTPVGTGTTYVRITGTWKAPAAARFARLDVVMRDTATGKSYHVDDLEVFKMADGSLVVDGTIRAIHIASQGIETDNLKAGLLNSFLITGANIQTSPDPNRGVVINSSGITGYSTGGLVSFSLNGTNGLVTAANLALTGTVNAVNSTLTGALNVTGSITGGTIQTTATSARGIMLNTTGLYGYNSSGTTMFSLNATTGALIASNATITGSITATSGTFTGTVNANAGNFSGSITSSATITGGIFQTASSGQRVRMDGTSIKLYSGMLPDTAATITANNVGAGGDVIVLAAGLATLNIGAGPALLYGNPGVYASTTALFDRVMDPNGVHNPTAAGSVNVTTGVAAGGTVNVNITVPGYVNNVVAACTNARFTVATASYGAVSGNTRTVTLTLGNWSPAAGTPGLVYWQGAW